MIRSLPQRAFRAYVAALVWVFDVVDDPFGPRVRRFHGGVSRVVNRYAGDRMYFEYDAWRHTYVIATDHHKTDPDDYEVGHTAGKLAAVLGALPVVAAMIAIEIFGIVAPHLPQHWIVSLAMLIVALGIALFALSAGYHWLFLSVEMQETDRDGGQR